ncbi:hypothetical protein [Jeongeupia chitinilytica]|nr:hypothetical protein [Jeongeupia chitinilytica]
MLAALGLAPVYATPYAGETVAVPHALPLGQHLPDDAIAAASVAATGCRRVSLNGYPTPPCLYAYTADQSLYMWFNPGQTSEHRLAITSWYGENRLGPLRLFADRAAQLSLTTTGVRGTGVQQRLWLVFDANAGQCRPLLLETLSAHQWVMADADYELHVLPHLHPGRIPRIEIGYQLHRVPVDGKRRSVINRWRDTLVWTPSQQRFALASRHGHPYLPATAEIDATRARIGPLSCDDFGVNGKAWEATPIMGVLDGLLP